MGCLNRATNCWQNLSLVVSWPNLRDLTVKKAERQEKKTLNKHIIVSRFLKRLIINEVGAPARWRLCRPLGLIHQRNRHIMKKKVIAPIKNRSFLYPQATTVPFIGTWRVGILLLHFKRQVKELTPNLASARHQLVANPMVHCLEETPIPTRAGDASQGLLLEGSVFAEQVLEINNRNVIMLIDFRTNFQGRPVT